MLKNGSIELRKRPDDCPFRSADDPEVINPILDALDAGCEVRQLAIEIASMAESTMWIIGKRRYTVAATAVYVAGVRIGESKPVFKQAEVAEASAASLSSIINHHEDLHSLFEFLSDSKLEA